MLKVDAMNEAIFNACDIKYGDVTQMLTTAFVARDLEEIRKAWTKTAERVLCQLRHRYRADLCQYVP